VSYRSIRLVKHEPNGYFDSVQSFIGFAACLVDKMFSREILLFLTIGRSAISVGFSYDPNEKRQKIIENILVSSQFDR